MKLISRRRFLSGLSVSSAVLVAACSQIQIPFTSSAPSLQPKSMTFMAGYKPQANVSFVGVYVARELGMFGEQKLDVTIKHSSGQGEHAKLLAGKQVQVVTETATDLIKNVTEEGIPFVSIAVLTQTGDEALVTLKNSGIDEPKKFEGKTVGYKVFPAFEYLAMLKAADVDRSKIREVSVGFDPRVLTQGKVDVLPVFKSNEPDVLNHLGFDLNVLDPATYGVQVMGQVWVTHRDLLASDPDMYARFVKAGLHGLSYAIEHPKEAVDIVMKYATTEDRLHQEYMLKIESGMTLTNQTRDQGIGWQSAERWGALQNGLAEFGLIKNKVDPLVLYSDALQKSIRTNGKIAWP